MVSGADQSQKGVLVDLFCGAGGFSLGAHAAGFAVAAAYDVDPILTSSYRTNFPDTKLVLGDLSITSGEKIVQHVGAPVDGIFGGPPCQGFSDIGRREVNDPRRELLGHFFRIVNEVRPKFFVMENVRGLAYAEARDVLNDAIASVRDSYFVSEPAIWNAADFGAATSRRRLFVIGIHKDHGDPFEESWLSARIKSPATVSQAISDLEGATRLFDDAGGIDWWKISKRGPASAYARPLRTDDGKFTSHRIIKHKEEVASRFALVRQGGMDNVGRHPRLSWDGQCPTLRAGTGADKGSRQAVRPLHPTEPRVITVREAARLQGFPDDHQFHRTVWHSFRMIGNSVSPIMSRAIFDALSDALAGAPTTRVAAE